MSTSREMKAAFLAATVVVFTAFALCDWAPNAKAGGVSIGNRYAAIAYSRSTRRWGYGRNHSTLAAAKAAALRQTNASDARVVVWGKNNWVALASGRGGSFGWGYASTSARARQLALQNVLRRSSYGRIVVSISARR